MVLQGFTSVVSPHGSNLLLQQMKDISSTNAHFLLQHSQFMSACLVCIGLVVCRDLFIWSFNTSWPVCTSVCVYVHVCAQVQWALSHDNYPETLSTTVPTTRGEHKHAHKCTLTHVRSYTHQRCVAHGRMPACVCVCLCVFWSWGDFQHVFDDSPGLSLNSDWLAGLQCLFPQRQSCHCLVPPR